MNIWKPTFESSVLDEEIIIDHLLEDINVVYDLALKKVIICATKRNEINEQP